MRTGEQSEAGASKEGEREGPFRRLRRRPGQRRGEQRSPFSLEGGSSGEMAALVCRRLDHLPNTPQAVTADGEHNPVGSSDSEAGGRPRTLSQKGTEWQHHQSSQGAFVQGPRVGPKVFVKAALLRQQGPPPPNPREWLCVLRKRTPRSRPEMTQQKEGRGPVSASDQAEPPWLPRVQTPGYGEEPKTDPGRSFDPGSSCSSVSVTRKQVPKRFLGERSYFGSRWPMKMQICGHHPVSSERSDQVRSFCPLIPAEGVCGPHCDGPRRSRSRHHFG